MDLSNFTLLYGYESREELMENSYTVIFDHGDSWLATITRSGWLAWIDKYPEKTLGTFQTFEQASVFIHKVFEETENYKKEIELFSKSLLN